MVWPVSQRPGGCPGRRTMLDGIDGTIRPSQTLRNLASYPRQNGCRPRRTLDVHDRLNHGPRHAPACQDGFSDPFSVAQRMQDIESDMA